MEGRELHARRGEVVRTLFSKRDSCDCRITNSGTRGGDENRKHSGFFFMSSMLLAQSARSEHAHQSALLGTRNGQRIHRFDLDPHPCVSAVVRSFRDVSFKVTNMEFAVTYSMEASKLQVQHLIWPD